MKTLHKVLIGMFLLAGIVTYNLGIFDQVIRVFLLICFVAMIFKIWFRKPKTVKDHKDEAAMIIWDKNGKEILRK